MNILKVERNTLHTKYRPSTLEEVVGMEEVVGSLQGAIEQGEKRSHAYLFVGPSGCGKTTLSRIFAQSVGAGRNVVEINAASVRGIDAIREVLEMTTARPFDSDARVIIFDEAHQLTKDAQNLLLKPVEEPPPFIYFIFCSTRPDKILDTIKTRCESYKVRRLTDKEIGTILNSVHKAEGMDEFPQDIAEAIVEASGGIPRTALIALEKANQVKDKTGVIDLLREGLIEDEPEVIELFRFLVGQHIPEWNCVVALLKGIEKKLDAEMLRIRAKSYFRVCLQNAPPQQLHLYSEMMEFLADPYYCSDIEAWDNMVWAFCQITRLRISKG